MQWYRPRGQIRETPAQRHYPVRNGTGRQPDLFAHNPKVVGLNPTPATIEKRCKERASGPAVCCFGLRCFYRDFRR